MSTHHEDGLFDKEQQKTFSHGLDLVVRALDLYGPEGLAFSFNGGKDSTAVLHLLLQGVRVWATESGKEYSPEQGLLGIRTFFFLNENEFPEVHQFVKDSDSKYNLDVHTYTCGFKDGMKEMVDECGIKAVFLGTRRGDPNCQDQEFFCPSSKQWPPFMRINPVLNWAYRDIWAYMRQVDAAVCPLYSKGYTSLGSVDDTAPNPALLRTDGSFAPAHELADGRLERSGRAVSRTPLRQQSSTCEHAPSACIVLIGDELLAGKITDANLQFLAVELHALGWKVRKVSILGDDIDCIAREIKTMRHECDIVITCGGVGPTADDCTVAALSVATDSHTTTDATFEASLREYFGSQVTSSHLKMATVVEGCTELLSCYTDEGQKSPFPLMRVDGNIYVLPGVPSVMRSKWPHIKKCLLEMYSSASFRNRLIQVKISDEAAIAPLFERIVEEFPDVAAGSYPQVLEGHGHIVAISLEAKDDGLLDRAVERYLALLQEQLGPEKKSEDYLLALKINVSTIDEATGQHDGT